MSSRSNKSEHRSAFTLIELLVVIAIIAILAVVVVLTLNPAQLLAQSRDANRISDMATINTALGLYVTDQQGSLGTASTSYISVPSASSSCATLGLGSTTGSSYQCASSTAYRGVSGAGWLPVNLSSISAGSPLSALPIDPVNQTSSNLYYSYATNGSQYILGAFFESTKYAGSMASTAGIDPALYETGTGVSTIPDFGHGLIGYWPLDEGSGAIAYDESGAGNNMTVASGASWTTSGCSVYTDCINLPGTNGSGDVYSPTTSTFQFTNKNFTFSIWVDPSSTVGSGANIAAGGNINGGSACQSSYGGWLLGTYYFIWCTPAQIGTVTQGDQIGFPKPATSTWSMVTVSFNSTGPVDIYINGSLAVSSSTSGGIGYQGSTAKIVIGCEDNAYNCLAASYNDARVYNRVLSATEIQEMYNAEE